MIEWVSQFSPIQQAMNKIAKMVYDTIFFISGNWFMRLYLNMNLARTSAPEVSTANMIQLICNADSDAVIRGFNPL